MCGKSTHQYLYYPYVQAFDSYSLQRDKGNESQIFVIHNAEETMESSFCFSNTEKPKNHTCYTF